MYTRHIFALIKHKDMKKRPLSNNLYIRVTESEKKKLIKAADKKGITPSEFVRNLINQLS